MGWMMEYDCGNYKKSKRLAAGSLERWGRIGLVTGWIEGMKKTEKSKIILHLFLLTEEGTIIPTFIRFEKMPDNGGPCF